MNLKSFFLLVLVSVTGINLSVGQDFSSRLWHSGWMVTMDRDTLRGDIKYDIPTNAVQIIVVQRQQKKIFTYSSKKIMYFQIFDVNLNNYRQFYSIPYKVRSDYKVPILFEILYEGPLTLMSRERIIVDTDPYQSYMYAGTSNTIERLVYTYYFINQKGQITMYEGGKGEIFEIFADQGDKVKDYVKENRLNIDELQDLVRITAFYNSL